MKFELIANDQSSKARAGLLTLPHGVIETPVFMPVGTNATVKTLTPDQLWQTGARLALANAYHLYLRPGAKVIQDAEGLHRFANWPGALLTDSGGYQVFSLSDLRKITNDGVRFKSHLDGSYHEFTPESVIDLERALGPDIMMVLDECPPSNAERGVVEQAVRRTLAWAERAMQRVQTTEALYGYSQAPFLIVQGGVHRDLREECAQKLVALGSPGYAIGGLAVGEPNEVMYQVIDWTTDILPPAKPRYLMGVGTPIDLVEAIERGVDMFDCVLPSRNARNGQLFTRSGKMNLRNAKWKTDHSILDPETNSYASQNFSKAYLAHLFNANEVLGLTLATIHNTAFYQQLMTEACATIINGTFGEWKRGFVQRYTAK